MPRIGRKPALAEASKKITAVRSSALTSYDGCARRSASIMFAAEIFGAGYEAGESRRSVAASVGTAVHFSAKVTLDEKARSGALPPVSISTDAGVENLKEEARKGLVYDRDSANLNDAQRQVIKMATAYHFLVAPKVEPVLIEERLEAVVPGTKQNLLLTGQPDLIARENNAVRDLKTGARLGAHSPQIGAYSLLGRSSSYSIDTANVDWVQRVGVKKPQPAPAVQTYDVADAESLAVDVLQRIDRDLTAFREGDPGRNILPGDARAFPANPSTMLCTEKYCKNYGVRGSHGFCREWMPKEAITR